MRHGRLIFFSSALRVCCTSGGVRSCLKMASSSTTALDEAGVEAGVAQDKPSAEAEAEVAEEATAAGSKLLHALVHCAAHHRLEHLLREERHARAAGARERPPSGSRRGAKASARDVLAHHCLRNTAAWWQCFGTGTSGFHKESGDRGYFHKRL